MRDATEAQSVPPDWHQCGNLKNYRTWKVGRGIRTHMRCRPDPISDTPTAPCPSLRQILCSASACDHYSLYRPKCIRTKEGGKRAPPTKKTNFEQSRVVFVGMHGFISCIHLGSHWRGCLQAESSCTNAPRNGPSGRRGRTRDKTSITVCLLDYLAHDVSDISRHAPDQGS